MKKKMTLEKECRNCKYYEYDNAMTRACFRQGENEDLPVIGRCTFGNKTCGNAVLSQGYYSDGVQGCNAFEHCEKPMFRENDAFEVIRENGSSCLAWIDEIQYKYSPRIYRMKVIPYGGFSESEKSLSDTTKYKAVWRGNDKERI